MVFIPVVETSTAAISGKFYSLRQHHWVYRLWNARAIPPTRIMYSHSTSKAEYCPYAKPKIERIRINQLLVSENERNERMRECNTLSK